MSLFLISLLYLLVKSLLSTISVLEKNNIPEFLIEEKCELIVIACGTVSSNCYYKLKSNYNVEIIDIMKKSKIKRNTPNIIGIEIRNTCKLFNLFIRLSTL